MLVFWHWMLNVQLLCICKEHLAESFKHSVEVNLRIVIYANHHCIFLNQINSSNQWYIVHSACVESLTSLVKSHHHSQCSIQANTQQYQKLFQSQVSAIYLIVTSIGLHAFRPDLYRTQQ